MKLATGTICKLNFPPDHALDGKECRITDVENDLYIVSVLDSKENIFEMCVQQQDLSISCEPIRSFAAQWRRINNELRAADYASIVWIDTIL